MNPSKKHVTRLEKPRFVDQIISWTKTSPTVESIKLMEQQPIYTIILKKTGVPDLLIDVDSEKKQVTFYTCELTNYPLASEIVPTKSPEIAWFLSEILELQSRTRIAKIILLRDDDPQKKEEQNNHYLLRLHLSTTVPINGLTRQVFNTYMEEHFWLSLKIAEKIEHYQLPQSWRSIEKDYKRKFEIPSF